MLSGNIGGQAGMIKVKSYGLHQSTNSMSSYSFPMQKLCWKQWKQKINWKMESRILMHMYNRVKPKDHLCTKITSVQRPYSN